ncbi:MAG: SDR family NAD(P)-dependent oxidoreductase [Mastigocoleus sp.]
MLKHKIQWDEKTAVITGSASGIGKAIAIALAKKGVTVHLVDIRQERIVAMLDELSCDNNICGHTVDVTVPEQLEQLATSLRGKVDILINCAGILHQGKLATTTSKELHQVMDVNLWGVINSIKAFLPQMSNSKQGGHIINIASIAGLIGAPEMSLYNASKCAILGLSESLAIELASEKIQVAAICPGSVNTNLSRDGLFSSNSTVAQTLHRIINTGVDPDRVALDIIQVIESSSLFKLSCVELHWQILWLCKRMFPSLYPKFASIFYHKIVDKGLLNFFLTVKTKIRKWLWLSHSNDLSQKMTKAD